MKVTEKLETLSTYDFEGDLKEIIQRLLNYEYRYLGKCLKLDYRSQEYGDGMEYVLVWEREENEDEAKKRLQEEVDRKSYRQKQYEQLKKEFEGS